MSVTGSSSATLQSWIKLALGTGAGQVGPWTTFIQSPFSTLAPADLSGDGCPDVASGGESWVDVFLS